MRLNINLASRKYEDVQRFFVRGGTALGVLAAFAILLATLAGRNYSSSIKSGREIRELQQKVAALQKERDRALIFENLPENRDVTEQRKFWNGQIAKRSFSWTQLFNDLQKIMPGRAYLASVQPELTPDNRHKLKLVIQGESQDNARELVHKMEGSTRFRVDHIDDETKQINSGPGAPPTYKFAITIFYMPANASSAHAGTKEGM